MSGRAVTIVKVIDGDTVLVYLGDGTQTRVRLAGIDAPERGEPLAQDATDALRDLLGGEGSRVELIDLGDRSYDRIVGYLRVAGVDVGEQMVGMGWALATRDFPHPRQAAYLAAAKVAAEQGAGIHADAPLEGEVVDDDDPFVGARPGPEPPPYTPFPRSARTSPPWWRGWAIGLGLILVIFAGLDAPWVLLRPIEGVLSLLFPVLYGPAAFATWTLREFGVAQFAFVLLAYLAALTYGAIEATARANRFVHENLGKSGRAGLWASRIQSVWPGENFELKRPSFSPFSKTGRRNVTALVVVWVLALAIGSGLLRPSSADLPDLPRDAAAAAERPDDGAEPGRLWPAERAASTPARRGPTGPPCITRLPRLGVHRACVPPWVFGQRITAIRDHRVFLEGGWFDVPPRAGFGTASARALACSGTGCRP